MADRAAQTAWRGRALRVEAYLYADALRILDEQTNYLYADLPTGQDVWAKDRLRMELVRELPQERSKTA